MSISIVIVYDHHLFAHGLASLLKKQTDMEIHGVASDYTVADKLVATHTPDIVILGPFLSDQTCTRLTRSLLAHFPELAVIALSPHDDAWHRRHVLELGCRALISSHCEVAEAVRAVRAVASGKRFLCGPQMEQSAASDMTNQLPLSALTRREVEVISLICDCYRTAEIADRLCISAKTVDSHRKNIMDKLEIRTVAGLTRYGLRHGLASSAMER